VARRCAATSAASGAWGEEEEVVVGVGCWVLGIGCWEVGGGRWEVASIRAHRSIHKVPPVGSASCAYILRIRSLGVIQMSGKKHP
jgi:hypothetical protein